nr:MAG TPA: hypothetical protein [Caudoviricetes sp.]
MSDWIPAVNKGSHLMVAKHRFIVLLYLWITANPDRTAVIT